MSLPNDKLNPQREWSGQRFVRHVAAPAAWKPSRIRGFEARDTGIGVATNGLASARVLRAQKQGMGMIQHAGEFLFYFVLRGELGLRSQQEGAHTLRQDVSCVVPAGQRFEMTGNPGLEMLELALPAFF